MEQKKKVILLAGPSASGKSELAMKLAKYFNGEIINADSMQVYKEVSILTSKPNSQDRKIIKHHLYGFTSVNKNFSTGHWLKKATKKIEKQWKNGKIPIVVGGTGLYFKALTDGLVKIPQIPSNIRTQVRTLHKKIGPKKFYIKLIIVSLAAILMNKVLFFHYSTDIYQLILALQFFLFVCFVYSKKLALI